jgi:predicted DNA-binding transcriptional regulator AlpA
MKVEIIKVTDGAATIDKVSVMHMRGLRLIRIKDFVRLGFETRPTLYDHIRKGEIKVYHPNGKVKMSSRNTPACICLTEWENIYENMPQDKAPVHITIKPRASTATKSTQGLI